MLLVEVVEWCFNMAMLALTPSGRYRPSSADTSLLLGATQHELQSYLQMSATCAGLGGAQLRPSCEPRLAAASAGSGAT